MKGELDKQKQKMKEFFGDSDSEGGGKPKKLTLKSLDDKF